MAGIEVVCKMREGERDRDCIADSISSNDYPLYFMNSWLSSKNIDIAGILSRVVSQVILAALAAAGLNVKSLNGS